MGLKSVAQISSIPRIITDHDRNVHRTAGEAAMHEALEAALANGHLPGWTIFEQPHLNGDRPDFVLTHPSRGIIVIEVKDLNLKSSEVQAYQPSPVHQLTRYQQNMLQLLAPTYVEMDETFGDKAFGLIEKAVYFHNATAKEGSEFINSRSRAGEASSSNVRVLDTNNVRAIANGSLRNAGLTTFERPTSIFSRNGLLESVVGEIESWMRPVDYTISRHTPVQLTRDQRAQAEPAPGIRRRLKGVAGGGKTLVLASRAANLLVLGKRVLFLTYNITLQHYVRDLIRQQFQGPTSRPLVEQLVLHHFHGFLRLVADRHNIELPPIPEDASPERLSRILEVEWVESLQAGLQGRVLSPDFAFDAVLIDEGQDFTHLWTTFAQSFLTKRNEFMIAFDDLQNVYSRDLVWLDSGGDVAGLGFSGPPAQLKTSHRLPPVMSELAQEFASVFLSGDDRGEHGRPTAAEMQAGLFDDQYHQLRWENVAAFDINGLTESVMETIAHAREAMGAHPNDIAVLAENEALALPIIRRLKSRGLQVAHVFDDRPPKKDEPGHVYRRQLKWRFQPADGRIKVCTLHSFKGWEAPYIICVLDAPQERQFQDPEDRARRAALIYVALTRLRRSNDGSSSLFALTNADPRFVGVEELFKRVNRAQASAKVATRSGNSVAEAKTPPPGPKGSGARQIGSR